MTSLRSLFFETFLRGFCIFFCLTRWLGGLEERRQLRAREMTTESTASVFHEWAAEEDNQLRHRWIAKDTTLYS